jgi:hypothetical protein
MVNIYKIILKIGMLGYGSFQTQIKKYVRGKNGREPNNIIKIIHH